MSPEREKLLRVMKSLEADYNAGIISEEKFKYFYSKYSDKLNAMNASNRIRSMQGKKSKPKKNIVKKDPVATKRKEEAKLVQKYIVEPKKGDYRQNKVKDSENDGSFKLVVFLILAIAFTAGIAYGVFNTNFGETSTIKADAVVHDTAFLDLGKFESDTNVTTTNNELEVDTSNEEQNTHNHPSNNQPVNPGDGSNQPVPSNPDNPGDGNQPSTLDNG